MTPHSQSRTASAAVCAVLSAAVLLAGSRLTHAESPLSAAISSPGAALSTVKPTHLHRPQSVPSCTLSPIPFAQDAAEIQGAAAHPGAEVALIEGLACLARSQERRVVVLGFASAEGMEAHNVNLSRRRAEGVAAYIAAHLPGLRVESFGLGDALPRRTGAGEDDLAPNRRAVLVASDRAPCQSIRIRFDSDGSLTTASLALVESHAGCYAARGVKQAMLVVSKTSHAGEERGADPHARAAATVRETMGRQVDGSSAVTVDVVYGTPGERAALGRALGLVTTAADEASAELYPLAWLPEEAPEPPATPAAPAAPAAASPSANVQAPVPRVEQRAALAPRASPGLEETATDDGFGQLRFGTMIALGQTHLGGSAQLGRSIVGFGRGRRTRVVLGGSLGLFGAENEYRLTEDLTSNFVFHVHALAGLSHRFGDLRLQASLLPGVVFPASAFLADADLTAGWSVSKRVELLAGAGAGMSVWGDATTDPHWSSQLGAGFWF